MNYTHDHAEGIFPDIYESEQGQYIHTVLEMSMERGAVCDTSAKIIFRATCAVTV